MSYQALARKYRPQTFSDVVGQETVVRTLQNAIETGRVHHAYLFSGVRGVGKTTAARILAKALNCVHGPTIEPCNECSTCREITEGIDLDVREIDAATYTGVDNVRELREVTQFQPARDRYRVFIIDEAHMLSMPSWNALLKLIEEPPGHVVFMFATTEIHKVPQTILSRVQKFMLRKITLPELIGRLDQISKAEKIETDPAALEIIARRGEGSVRDALSLLDQVIAFSGRRISAVEVSAVLGLSDTNFFGRIVDTIAAGDHGGLLEALQEASDSGRDFKMLYRDLLNFVRNLLLVAGGASPALVSATPEDLPIIERLAGQFSYTELLRIANLLLRDDETVNRAEHQRLAVEIALLKAATFPRLRAIEQIVAAGGVATAAASPARPASPSRPAAERRATAPAAPSRESERPAERSSRTSERTSERAPERSIDREESPAPATPSAGGDLAPLLERLQAKKPLIATYLSQAKRAQKEGARVTWTFDDAFVVDTVNDARAAVEQIAAEVYGTKIAVEATLEKAAPAAARRATDAPPAENEDPVLRSFQKHLGGEVIAPKKR